MRTYSELSVQDKVKIYKIKHHNGVKFSNKATLAKLEITAKVFKKIYKEIKKTLISKNDNITLKYALNNTQIVFAVKYEGNGVGTFDSYTEALRSLSIYKDKWVEVRDLYLPKLKDLIIKNNMMVGFRVSSGSDTSKLYEPHMYLWVIHEGTGYNIKLIDGWSCSRIAWGLP